MSQARRCVCGRSARFPVCDGTHTSETWSCAAPVPEAVLAVVSSPSLSTLAEKLAVSLGGVFVRPADPAPRVEELVIITDASDLGLVRALAGRITALRRRVIAVGVCPDLLAHAFPNAVLVNIPDGPAPALWTQLRAVASGTAAPAPLPARPRRWFVSHAVADEARLLPHITAMRDLLGLPVFVCLDSIHAGTDWSARIRVGLEHADALLFVLSESSARSTFCAWELGWAEARGLPVRVVRVDSTPPPAPIQHVQLVDAPRIAQARPWLDDEAALWSAILAALAPRARATDDSAMLPSDLER